MATSMLKAAGAALSDGAAWLVGHVLVLVTVTSSPSLDAAWFLEELHRMEAVAALGVLPLLLVASTGALLRQDSRRLWRIWGVGLPVSVLAGLAAVQVVDLALRATDAMCTVLVGGRYDQLGAHFSAAMTGPAAGGAPVVVQMLLSTIAVIGAVTVWLELIVRSAGVYVATFFMPLALVAYIWPATAHMAKRGVEILAALILSKFVIIACLDLGLAAMGGRGSPGGSLVGAAGTVDAAMSGAALLLLAAFAPFALLRLAPVVEAAAIGHLEGVARRPAAAAMGASAAASSPLGQLVLTRLSGGGDGPPDAARPVVSQPLPEHPADFPLPPEAGIG